MTRIAVLALCLLADAADRMADWLSALAAWADRLGERLTR